MKRYLAARRGNAVLFSVRLMVGRRVRADFKAGRKPDLQRIRALLRLPA